MKKIMIGRFHLHIHLGILFGMLIAAFGYWAMQLKDVLEIVPTVFLLICGFIAGHVWEGFWETETGSEFSWFDVFATSIGFYLGLWAYRIDGNLWIKALVIAATFVISFLLTHSYIEAQKRKK